MGYFKDLAISEMEDSNEDYEKNEDYEISPFFVFSDNVKPLSEFMWV